MIYVIISSPRNIFRLFIVASKQAHVYTQTLTVYVYLSMAYV